MLAWLDVAPEITGSAAFVGIVLGLVFAIPTVVTGFLDYFDLPAQEPPRRTATGHLITMLIAAGLFLAAAVLLAPHARTGAVGGGEVLVTVVAFAVLTIGGWFGGSLAYVHGVRVTGDAQTPMREAVRPRLLRR